MTPFEVDNRTAIRLMLIARILMASHFILGGLEKILRYDAAVGFATLYHIPFARILMAPAAAIELVGAALLISPRWCRQGAAMLGVWLLFLGVWFHRFWEISWVQSPAEWHESYDSFFHHIVMFGGFVYVALVGTGASAKRARQDGGAA